MRGLPPTLARLLTLLSAGVVVVAFFLPWMEGEAELRYRAFSGFDFARLVRNFEITAASASGIGQFRATAVALYLVPALAINAVVLHELAQFFPEWRNVTQLALLAAALYVLVMLASLLALSVLPINEFEGVVGVPTYGFGLAAGGALVLGWTALSERYAS